MYSTVPQLDLRHSSGLTRPHPTVVCTLSKLIPLLLLAPAERALMRASAEERAVELESREEQPLPPLEAGT